MQEKGKIVQEGMGGLLCPPGHPAHTQSVETDLRRKPENRSRMSLEHAVDSTELDSVTLAVVRTVLAAWAQHKPPLDSPQVREWILQVLGYFRGCFNFHPESEEGWHAVNLTIDAAKDPLTNADFHAGVHLIRQYYPDYQPTAADFTAAYWGKKPA
jgi:hypothetical protein